MTHETLDALRTLQQHMDALPAQRGELIAQARAEGHSWKAIGNALGMSHVAAMKAPGATGQARGPRKPAT